MRNILALLAVGILALIASPSFAQTYNGPCYRSSSTWTIDSGCTLNVKSGGTVTRDAGSIDTFNGAVAFNSTIAPQGTAFSTSLTGNPLQLMTVQSLPIASVNGTYNFLSGVTGRTIYPTGALTVMAYGGAAAGATSIKILCSPSGRLIATIPVGNLASAIPVTVATTNGTTQATFASNGLTQGCQIGDSVQASTVGSALTTATAIFVNMPYTLQ